MKAGSATARQPMAATNDAPTTNTAPRVFLQLLGAAADIVGRVRRTAGCFHVVEALPCGLESHAEDGNQQQAQPAAGDHDREWKRHFGIEDPQQNLREERDGNRDQRIQGGACFSAMAGKSVCVSEHERDEGCRSGNGQAHKSGILEEKREIDEAGSRGQKRDVQRAGLRQQQAGV